MMLSYDDVVAYLTAGLAALPGAPYGAFGDPTFPIFDPGPPTPQKMLVAVGLLVFVSVGGGAGFTTEQLFDRPFITVRSLGNTNDFTGAQQLAQDLDKILVAANGNTTVGSTKVLYITRTGGAPVLYAFDTSDRYNFTCSYISEAQTGY